VNAGDGCALFAHRYFSFVLLRRRAADRVSFASGIRMARSRFCGDRNGDFSSGTWTRVGLTQNGEETNDRIDYQFANRHS
jgi:hypothetical protein